MTDPEPKLLILTYHRILPAFMFNPLNTIISLRTFESHIDILARKFAVISLGEAVNQMGAGQAKAKIQAVLTFDDGYKDNYETVFPLLKKKGLPAAFFVSTGYIGTNTPLWDSELIKRLSVAEGINKVEVSNRIFNRGSGESRLSFALRIFEEMKSWDEPLIYEALDFLRRKTSGCDLKEDSCMDWAQIEEISKAGMEIGAHGITHRSLNRVPFEEAVEEIKIGKSNIESRIKKECVHFAFPFGSENDYNGRLIDSVRDAGFQTCLLNIHGYNHVGSDNFRLKRIIMEEFSQLNFLLG